MSGWWNGASRSHAFSGDKLLDSAHAAPLTASLAVIALQRSGGRSAGFVHQFSHCRKHLCHTPKFFARIDLIVDIPRLRDGIQDAGTIAKEGNALKAANAES